MDNTILLFITVPLAMIAAIIFAALFCFIAYIIINKIIEKKARKKVPVELINKEDNPQKVIKEVEESDRKRIETERFISALERYSGRLGRDGSSEDRESETSRNSNSEGRLKLQNDSIIRFSGDDFNPVQDGRKSIQESRTRPKIKFD
jgi:hypothetical protein